MLDKFIEKNVDRILFLAGVAILIGILVSGIELLNINNAQEWIRLN